MALSETERIRSRKALHSFLADAIKDGFKGWKFVDENNEHECDIYTFAESTADDVMAALADLCR